ncbi:MULTISPECIES: hypothetical protein [Alloalcanivorax]|uniref:Uncharacterized protein n=1 Tax=Alloalcanivorax xenomutans TaxID=1094342 RepID=A0A9Q3ZEX1_9GAMM|nr:MULTISPECIES: hypothetical protein [Alloalcanivorax]MCE7511170.1 hypothetical protein [Alloalcanivorax xenomutans]GGJ83757.1 hypothetical protein GCM10007426_11080 [Alloalcanivorax dieselolei]
MTHDERQARDAPGIDWHALFEDYQWQAQRVLDEHAELRRRDPFHPDAYPDTLRITFPGGAELLLADTVVIRAEQMQVHCRDQWMSPEACLSAGVISGITALSANGHLLTFTEDTRIQRYGCHSRLRATGGDVAPTRHNGQTVKTYLVWVTGTLQGISPPG